MGCASLLFRVENQPNRTTNHFSSDCKSAAYHSCVRRLLLVRADSTQCSAPLSHLPCSPSLGEHITRPPCARAPPSQELRGIRCFQGPGARWNTPVSCGRSAQRVPPSWSTRRGGGSVYDFRPQPHSGEEEGDGRRRQIWFPAPSSLPQMARAPARAIYPRRLCTFVAARNSWKAPPPPPRGGPKSKTRVCAGLPKTAPSANRCARQRA